MNDKKPLGKKNYGSIPHLINSKIYEKADKKISESQGELLTKKTRDRYDLIIVQEKVDGSNVGVCKIGNQIYPIGRSGYLANTSRFKQHKLFYDWVMLNYKRFFELLEDGERVCGEWLLQVHSLKYELKHEPFVVFDIIKGDERLPYISFLKRVLKYDFITANLVHIGQPISTDKAMKILDCSVHNCLEEPEGLVYRLERKGKVEFLAKYVRPGKEDGKYMVDEIYNKGWEQYFKI